MALGLITASWLFTSVPPYDTFARSVFGSPKLPLSAYQEQFGGFLKPFTPDINLLRLEQLDVAFPPTRERPEPTANGSDLLGRHFVEPELGVCCVTRIGPVLEKQLPRRAELRAMNGAKRIALGAHHTLYYVCVTSQEEYYSSVEEIVEWIRDGPILQPPSQPSVPDSCLPITIPSYVQPRDGPSLTLPVLPTPSLTPTTPAAPIGQPVPVAPVAPPQPVGETTIGPETTVAPAPPSNAVPSRASSRKRKAIDFLKPLLTREILSRQYLG